MTSSTPEPGAVTPPDIAAGQQLFDGGALEADGEQHAPLRAPKTDAADDSAGQQDDPLPQPGRGAAAEGDALASHGATDPAQASPCRSESAAGLDS